MGAVVVIGHGPSLEGAGCGKMFDAQSAVVRMWNNSWQSRGDYGTRYDYGLFCPPLAAHLTVPSQCWWAYDVLNPRDEAFVDDECDPIDGVPVDPLRFEPWTARALSMGGGGDGRKFKLTRGCAAVCASIDLLSPETLILAGMDMMRAGATVSPRYGAGAQADFDLVMAGRDHVFKPPGHAREAAHDHAVEGALVRAMAAENGIELVWLP